MKSVSKPSREPIFTTRFAIALFMLALAATLLMIGMWQGTTGTSQLTYAHNGEGSPTTTRTSMLAWYIPIIMIMAPLITATAALIGVTLGYWLSSRERRRVEQRRRRVLATTLLSEVRFLEGLLRDITTAVIPGEPGEEIIEPYRTAVYDSAGANLLLFSRETVHDLDALYQLVHRLREELQELRRGQIDAGVDHYHTVRLRAIYAAVYIQRVALRLRDDEGGMWPRPLPFWRVPADELPPLPLPVFEDNNPRRSSTPWPESDDDPAQAL